MSMVTVHGPNTMYTGTPGQGGSGAGLPVASVPAGAQAVQSPTNGLQFACSFPQPGANPAADFVWSATGSPTFTPSNIGPNVTCTFASAGARTITCTVSGATPPPTNQAYNINVTAVAGVPQMAEGSGGEVPVTAPADGVITDVQVAPSDKVQEGDVVATEATGTSNGNGEYVDYDPGEYTVSEVVNDVQAENDPEFTLGVIEAERAGKNRSTLIGHLQDIYNQQTST